MATFNPIIVWIIFVRPLHACAALHSYAPGPDLWGRAPKGAMKSPSTLQGVKARGWAALSGCLWARLSHAKGRGEGQIPSLCLPLRPRCQSSIFISLPIPCNALIAQTPSHCTQGLRVESCAQPGAGWSPRRTYSAASGVCSFFSLFQVGLSQRKEKQPQGPSGSTWTLLLALAFPSEEGFVSLTLAGLLPTALPCHQPCPTSALCRRAVWLRDAVPQWTFITARCVSSGPMLLTVNTFAKPWSPCKIKGCGPHARSREGRSRAACWKGSAGSQSPRGPWGAMNAPIPTGHPRTCSTRASCPGTLATGPGMSVTRQESTCRKPSHAVPVLTSPLLQGCTWSCRNEAPQGATMPACLPRPTPRPPAAPSPH